MNVHKLFTDERAVSPVVGVALLIAVAVILAAVIGAVVLGLGSGGAETPQAQLQAEFGDDADTNVTIDHNGGDPLPEGEIVFKSNENNVDMDTTNATGYSADELNAGESVEINYSAEPTEVSVVWEDPNSDKETVLEEFSA